MQRTDRKQSPDRPHALAHGISLAAALLCVLALGGRDVAQADEYNNGEMQIEVADGVPIDTINDRYETTVLDSLPPLYLLELPPDANEAQVLQQMLMDPDIAAAEYSWDNQTPEAIRQMVVTAIGGTIEDYLDQGLVDRLQIPEAHEHTKGDGVLVALLDTGVLATHAALDGAIDPGGYDFVDDDADPTDGANGVDDDGDGEIDEGAGHGTMVAGIVRLIAPNARILPIRVLDDEGSGRTFAVAKGIRYAVEHGAQLINMSLGLGNSCWIIGHEIAAAKDASLGLIAAAGNDSAQAALYPARDEDVLGVAALDSADVKAGFSNWHPTLDLSAPGVGVLAPYYDGEYAIGAGTSFAAPFITGQLALVLATNPYLSVDTVYSTARIGVFDIYRLQENQVYQGMLGAGRVDAYQTWVKTPKAADVPGQGDIASGPALRISPNPAQAGHAVLIRWSGGRTGGWRASVLDAAGRRVRALSFKGPGALQWDGRDEKGRRASAGAYFIRVEDSRANEASAGGRVILLDP